MGGASVINDVKTLSGKDQVKVFEKEVMGADGSPLLLEIIGDGQKEVMEGKGFLAQEAAHVPDPVRGGGCLAEKADHCPVRVLKIDDMPAVGTEFLCVIVAERVIDALQPIQSLFCWKAVFRMDPAAGFFHLRKLSRMFDAETQILEPVHEEKSAGLFCQRNQYLACMPGFEQSFFFTEAGDCGQVVDPVRDLYIESPGVNFVQELCVRKDIIRNKLKKSIKSMKIWIF